MAFDPFTLAALALSAAGTGASIYAQNQASNAQQEAALNALRNQQQQQDEINNAVRGQVDSLDADSRADREQTAEDSITARLNSVIGQAREQGPASITPGVEGRVSSDALTRTAAATERQALDSASLARLLGQVQAPLRGRQQEAFGAADLASRVGTLGNFAQGDAGVDARAIQQAGQVNPYLAGAGQIATSVGNAGVANGGFGQQTAASDFQGLNLGTQTQGGNGFYSANGPGYIIDLPRG